MKAQPSLCARGQVCPSVTSAVSSSWPSASKATKLSVTPVPKKRYVPGCAPPGGGVNCAKTYSDKLERAEGPRCEGARAAQNVRMDSKPVTLPPRLLGAIDRRAQGLLQPDNEPPFD